MRIEVAANDVESFDRAIEIACIKQSSEPIEYVLDQVSTNGYHPSVRREAFQVVVSFCILWVPRVGPDRLSNPSC